VARLRTGRNAGARGGCGVRCGARSGNDQPVRHGDRHASGGRPDDDRTVANDGDRITFCPEGAVIAIADPCPAVYMNEAYNSWVSVDVASGPEDPYGYC
jgi:hypothetical protein